jgi:hypothetical protein
MSKGPYKIVILRNNPVDAYTMAAIVRDAGMSLEKFKTLLWGLKKGLDYFFRNRQGISHVRVGYRKAGMYPYCPPGTFSFQSLSVGGYSDIGSCVPLVWFC